MGRAKEWWRSVRPKVLPPIIYAAAGLIGRSVRLETPGWEKVQGLRGGKICAGWHGRTFLGTSLFRGLGVYALISHSRDGEMQAGIFRRFGFRTIRGSTGRGGIKALLESIKVLQDGAMMAFTPDGPRGPSGVVQEGIMLMAKKSGAAVVPVGVSARWRWLAPTWDRYLVPLPFTRAIMIFGEPMRVPADAGPEEVEALRLALQAEIHRLEKEAEARMGHASPPA